MKMTLDIMLEIAPFSAVILYKCSLKSFVIHRCIQHTARDRQSSDTDVFEDHGDSVDEVAFVFY